MSLEGPEEQANPEILSHPTITLDSENKSISINDETTELRPETFKHFWVMLSIFNENDQPVTVRNIFNIGRDKYNHWFFSSTRVSALIYQFRKITEENPKDPKILMKFPKGVGYILNADLEFITPEDKKESQSTSSTRRLKRWLGRKRN